MKEKYVIRKNTFENRFELDYMRPHEALYSAINDTTSGAFYRSDYQKLINNLLPLIHTLSSREAKILLYRFGFTGEWLTLEETGKKLGFTRERVRQLENKVLRKLRLPARKKIIHQKEKLSYSERDILCEHDSPIKKFMVSEFKDFLFNSNGNALFNTILRKNDIHIYFNKKHIGPLHYIDDLKLSVLTYNSLKMAGIKTLEEFVNMSPDKHSKMKSTNRKAYEQILAVVNEYNIQPSTVLSKDTDGAEKLISFIVYYKGIPSLYKLEDASDDELTNQLYEILTNTFEDAHPIYDYKIPTGLLFLLLAEGYLFVDKIIEDAELIKEQLTEQTYSEYVCAFNTLIEQLTDCYVDATSPMITFCAVDTATAKRIVRKTTCNLSEVLSYCSNTTTSKIHKNLTAYLCKLSPDCHFSVNIEKLQRSPICDGYIEHSSDSEGYWLEDYDDDDFDYDEYEETYYEDE